MLERNVRELLKEMTLDEKIGQMIQVAGEVFLEDEICVTTGPLKNLDIPENMISHVGSVLNIIGAERVEKVQNTYLQKSRLKIPLLFMDDVINGYKIAFPIPIAQGCSWNIKVIKQIAQIAAMESSIAGADVNFSPMVDLSRDARWGRVMESVGGEDPYLGEIYASIIVDAYQGDSLKKTGNIASCVKHIAAYGAVEAGRDYNTVDMSEREFRQYYLPAYRAAIDSGVEIVMTSFNIINGIPSTINKWLIQNILRKELKFKGIIISDYGAIEETITHGASKDGKEAAKNAIMAGVDIDMMSPIYAKYLKELCMEDKTIEEKVNESVYRILTLKNKLGLFEKPYGKADREKEKTYMMNAENLERTKQLVKETFVLLKNKNNVLPLKKSQKIAFIGPYADNCAITGSWNMFSDKSKNNTLLEAFKKVIGENKLVYAKGTEILRQREINNILKADGLPLVCIENELEKEKQMREEAIEVAKNADVIVLALGEHYKQTGEACSRSTISLPINQILLIEELAKLHIPMVMILFNGRPIELSGIEDKLEGILEVWFPRNSGSTSYYRSAFWKNKSFWKVDYEFSAKCWSMSYLLQSLSNR